MISFSENFSEHCSHLSFPLVGNLSSKKDAGQAGMTETETNVYLLIAVLVRGDDLCTQ